MKKFVLLFQFCLLFILYNFPTSLVAQESFLKNRLKIKFDLETVKRESYKDYSFQSIYNLPSLGIGTSAIYTLNKNIECGGYIAYSTVGHIYMQPISDINYPYYNYGLYKPDGTLFSGSTSNSTQPTNTLFYGFSASYQLLPLIIENQRLRFDVYVTGKVGAVSARWLIYDGFDDYVYIWNKPFIEYGIGLGGGYNFTKHIGFFSEYSVGRFYNSNSSRAIAGLVIKF